VGKVLRGKRWWITSGPKLSSLLGHPLQTRYRVGLFFSLSLFFSLLFHSFIHSIPFGRLSLDIIFEEGLFCESFFFLKKKSLGGETHSTGV